MIHATIISLCLLILAAPALAQKRIALLIGNQDYKRGVGKLVNPFNDIRIVGAALREVGFDVMRPVRNATRADILEAVENYAARLKRAGPNAIGFIYYSGHGIASRGKNYLIPVDLAKPSTKLLRANGVKQSEVLDIIRQEAPQAAHYFIIDACRNELQGARGAKGFVAVNQQAGTLIAFATSPGRTASDLGDGSGPYAKALAAELVKPGVTDLQMFSNVRFSVASATGGDQVPWTLDGIVRRDRVLFGGAGKSSVPASEAAQAWRSIADSKDPKDFKAYRAQYGETNPLYDRLAKKRLSLLERKPSLTITARVPSQKSETTRIVYLESIIGPPSAKSAQLMTALKSALAREGVKVVDRGTVSAKKMGHTIRGYVVVGRKSGNVEVSYIWDVIRSTGARVHRISSHELVLDTKKRDPWLAVSKAVFDRIAAKTASDLKAWYSN